MSDSLIPKNRGLGGAAVSVSTGGGHPGFGAQPSPQAQQQTYTTPGAMLKQYLGGQGGGGGATSSFNWKVHSGGIESSEVLGRMLNGEANDDSNSKEYYVDKVAQYVFHFSESIKMNKHQTMFYQFFVTVRDNFHVDRNTQAICPMKKDFVESIMKLHDFKRVVGFNGSIIFGYLLVDHLKKTGLDDWTDQEVQSACQLAISHVLSFEFVNWVVATKKGRSWQNRLPPEIDRFLGNFETTKEQFALMWEMFDMAFPYANLSFAKTTSAPLEYHRVFDPTQYGDTFGRVASEFNPAIPGGYEDIYQMVQRNAASRKGFVEEPRPIIAANNQDIFREVGTPMDTVRYDFMNINRANMHEFAWQGEFKPIGRPNHYWVCESSWIHLNKLFERHPEQKQEEVLSNYHWRIVIIDLEGARQWQSITVRSERLTVQYLMSNPSQLLPLLEKSEHEDLVVPVQVTPVDVVDHNNKLEIDLDTVKELGEGTPIIAIKDGLVGSDTAELLGNVDLITGSLTANFKDRRAGVAIPLAEWDSYSLRQEEGHVKQALFDAVPYIFDDRSDKTSAVSIYQVGKKLRELFADDSIPAGLKGFIDGRLTDVVNQWLVNTMGYNAVSGLGGEKLQIDSFLGDFVELSDYLKENDHMGYEALHDSTRPGYLSEGIKIFYFNNPYGKDPKEMVALEKLKSNLELYVVREVLMINVINDKGPMYTGENVAGYVRRSVWPDLFKMVEDGFKQSMPEGADPAVTDKLVRFRDSDNIWLFSYTATDRNVATMRHVVRNKPLVLLKQD